MVYCFSNEPWTTMHYLSLYESAYKLKQMMWWLFSRRIVCISTRAHTHTFTHPWHIYGIWNQTSWDLHLNKEREKGGLRGGEGGERCLFSLSFNPSCWLLGVRSQAFSVQVVFFFLQSFLYSSSFRGMVFASDVFHFQLMTCSPCPVFLHLYWGLHLSSVFIRMSARRI